MSTTGSLLCCSAKQTGSWVSFVPRLWLVPGGSAVSPCGLRCAVSHDPAACAGRGTVWHRLLLWLRSVLLYTPKCIPFRTVLKRELSICPFYLIQLFMLLFFLWFIKRSLKLSLAVLFCEEPGARLWCFPLGLNGAVWCWEVPAFVSPSSGTCAH